SVVAEQPQLVLGQGHGNLPRQTATARWPKTTGSEAYRSDVIGGHGPDPLPYRAPGCALEECARTLSWVAGLALNRASLIAHRRRRASACAASARLATQASSRALRNSCPAR